jgi:hypothetical protein
MNSAIHDLIRRPLATAREHARGIAALFKLVREGRLAEIDRLGERGRIMGLFQITRFQSPRHHYEGIAYDIGKPFANIFVNVGLVDVWSLVTNQASKTAFSNANAYLGVGDSSTAAAVGQTDLQSASNKTRIAMNASYPNAPSNGLEQWQSTFASGNANYSWNEFAIFNASSSGDMLNRSVSSQGTKVSGQSWQLTYSFTLS